MWAAENKKKVTARIPVINYGMSADGTENSSLNYVFL